MLPSTYYDTFLFYSFWGIFLLANTGYCNPFEPIKIYMISENNFMPEFNFLRFLVNVLGSLFSLLLSFVFIYLFVLAEDGSFHIFLIECRPCTIIFHINSQFG